MSTPAETLIATITETTFSLSAAVRRVGALRQAVDTALYQEGDDFLSQYEAALRELLHSEEQEVVLAWGATWVTTLTAETWRPIDQALETWLSSVPTVTLYVPAALDADGEASLGTWCREQFGEGLLVDFQVDPNTVGGCALVRNGHYIDLSLAAQLDAQPNLVPAIIKSYDR
jgi:hypothetical protein